jgi:uncharacterized membrane protein YbhN (UPF0104 family)
MARVSLSFKRIFRPLLALGLLALLILNLKHAEFLHSLAATKPVFIIGAIAAVILDGLARAWNWTQLIRAMHPGKPVRFGVVLSLYWSSGSFMGHFLPSTAGTDALRAMLAARRVGGPVSAHAAGVVMLNVISLLTGCAVGLACVVWMVVATHGEGVRWVSMGLFAGPIFAGAIGYWLLRDQRGFVLRLLRLMRGRLRKLRRGIRRFMDRLLVFERLDVRAGPIFGIAVLTLLTRATVYALVGYAVGLELPVPAWVALVPGYALSGLIPYSVSGYGGDQAAIVYFLTGFGAPAAKALAFALIVPLITLIFNMLGGFAVLFGKIELPADQPAAVVAGPNS